MDINDIRDAVEAGRSEQQTAFRALVGFPGEDRIGGDFDAAELTELLDLICDELLGDDAIMPSGTVDAIEGLQHDRLIRTDYAGGAAAVQDNLGRWRSYFAARLGEAIANG